MKNAVTMEQLADFLALQAKHAQSCGEGYKAEFQGFLATLKSGGVKVDTTDLRTAQTKKYWDLGLGTVLGYESFQDFLASVPEIPAALHKEDERFPFLVLVLPRNDRLTLTTLCEKVRVEMLCSVEQLIAFDKLYEDFAQMKWVRMQDGRRNRNKRVRDCRNVFRDKERGLTAFQAVCAIAHYPQMVADLNGFEGGVHVMDLPGSVSADNLGNVAFLSRRDGRLRLSCDWDGNTDPNYGSASFRDC